MRPSTGCSRPPPTTSSAQRATDCGSSGRSCAIRPATPMRPTACSRPTFDEIAGDPTIAVVAEVMGGLEPAGSYVLDLLARGKHVVTANKQLVARRAPELFAAAASSGAQLRFEASVCAAIPVIKVLREALVVTNVHRVLGIVNGTTNFVLTEMEGGATLCRRARRRAGARLRRSRSDRRRLGRGRRGEDGDPRDGRVQHARRARGCRPHRDHRGRPDRRRRGARARDGRAARRRGTARRRRLRRARRSLRSSTRNIRWPRSTARSTP